MLNKAILQGRLTATPELKHTEKGNLVTSFTLAVDRDYKQEGGPTADFINCVAWGKSAEFITKYFVKGQQMIAEGSIQIRTYNDKQGVTKYITEVNVSGVKFCGPKQQAGQPAEADEPSNSQQGFTEVDNDDDLPF